MLTNYHTHTTFCDGKSTPEEIVLYSIEKGFSSVGFSGHGYTPFDLRYCMKDTTGYIEEISRLKTKYSDKIEIYCGVEEDALSYINRESFDYIIGSLHYICVGDKYYPVDSSIDYFNECLQAFDNDALKLADNYYRTFVSYIADRKPDIVGHFDLITKFEEIGTQHFLNNKEYLKLSEKYLKMAAKSDVIFEINTGAISRKIRKTPYPWENLLSVLKTEGCKVILSSDSHSADTMSCCFDEVEYMLRNIGFDCVYELHQGKFEKRFL